MDKKKINIFFAIRLLVFGLILLIFAKQPVAQTETPAAITTSDQVQAIIDRGVLRVGVKQDVPNFGYKIPILVNLREWRLTSLAKLLMN